MAILRMNQIREMDADQLNKKLIELHVELGKLRTTVYAGGKVENPGRIHEIKKTIARIETAKKERR